MFHELWDSGQVLTEEKLVRFTEIHRNAHRRASEADSSIEDAVGRAEPRNINVASHTRSRERIFVERLRQEIYEQYRPAFNEVTRILDRFRFRRDDLVALSAANETNRFLNYVRVTHVIGDETWRSAPLRNEDDRQREIIRLGREWVEAADNRVPEDFSAWLGIVAGTFGSRDALDAATKDDVTNGLMSLHAFVEQFRFVTGGAQNLPAKFWKGNNDDLDRVKATLSYLLHGRGDFAERLHDVLYDPSRKLSSFAYFCALELYGTVHSHDCPPINGRMAKALRYLGFDVKAA